MTVSRTHHGAVSVVSIASPENRNALTTELLLELADTLEALDAEPGVGAVVLTGGAGPFASGADWRALLDVTPEESAASPRAGAWRRFDTLGVPLVAAVAGWAL